MTAPPAAYSSSTSWILRAKTSQPAARIKILISRKIYSLETSEESRALEVAVELP